MNDMKTCVQCGEPVSPLAKACPKCGQPNPSQPQWVHGASALGSILMLVGIGLLLLSGFGLCQAVK